jgi:hypothetical protein
VFLLPEPAPYNCPDFGTRLATEPGMKRAIGSILCILGVLTGVGHFVGQKPEDSGKSAQDWAVTAVFLTIGLALSNSKKKTA